MPGRPERHQPMPNRISVGEHATLAFARASPSRAVGNLAQIDHDGPPHNPTCPGLRRMTFPWNVETDIERTTEVSAGVATVE